MATSALPARSRHTAEDRREELIAAALREFAEHGYHGASTAAIARRAGISQPYIYALFPSKQALFVAVHDRVFSDLQVSFAKAAKGATPHERLESMGLLYPALIADRYSLLVQLQSYATSEPVVREHVALRYRELFDLVERLSGAPRAAVSMFFACGMLANVTTALGLSEICDPLFAGHGEGGVAGVR
ncbi:MAG: TetR/AcrR family transcriptional regulator [Candidatus Dormibacteraeota bacterium]|nr:TetR/AcrR family transcriptional regulator [Candidatus Dormibacteraeota bacterium]